MPLCGLPLYFLAYFSLLNSLVCPTLFQSYPCLAVARRPRHLPAFSGRPSDSRWKRALKLT